MHKLMIVSLAAATLFAGAADAKGPTQRLVRDGQTFLYSVNTRSDGSTVIDGRRLPSGSGFHLVVRDGRISGSSGGWPVSEAVPVSSPLSAPAEVAAR